MQHAAAVEKVLFDQRVRTQIALRVHRLLCVRPIAVATDLVGVMKTGAKLFD